MKNFFLIFRTNYNLKIKIKIFFRDIFLRLKEIYFTYLDYTNVKNSKNIHHSYLFYFVPKCGGTYFRDILQYNTAIKSYDENLIQKIEGVLKDKKSSKKLKKIANNKIKKIFKFHRQILKNPKKNCFYFVHNGFYKKKPDLNKYKKIILIRNPIDREISNYNYYKNFNKKFNLNKFDEFKEYNLKDYINSKLFLDNIITRILCNKMLKNEKIYNNDFLLALSMCQNSSIVFFNQIKNFVKKEFKIKNLRKKNYNKNKSIKFLYRSNIDKKDLELIKKYNKFDLNLYNKFKHIKY